MRIEELKVFNEEIPLTHMLIVYAGEGSPIGIVRAPVRLEYMQYGIRRKIISKYVEQCNLNGMLKTDVDIYDAGRIVR